MTRPSVAHALPYAPIALRACMLDCGLTQVRLRERLAELLGCPLSRPLVNLTVNKGYVASTLPGYREAVEKALGEHPGVGRWLAERGLKFSCLWKPLPSPSRLRSAMAAGHGERTRQGMRIPATIPGDPTALEPHLEVEMISPEALRHFRLFRNPFFDDVLSDRDVFLSEEHRYIEAAMLDAARHGGFLAVIGEVGSGKSVMRRKVIEQLKKDENTLVVYPQMIDKTRLTAGSICDAIIQDVSSERCKSKLEDKTRQVSRLLVDRAKSGYRAVLVIEEAHDLSVPTLKYLKRFYELEHGYQKLLGIILVGQTELRRRFDEREHNDMREVIRRVQVAEIAGLNGHLREYLTLKFKRLNRDPAEIFAHDAFDAMGRRLTVPSADGRKSESTAYPLTVNNLAARCMNLAAELGEALVTASVVERV